MTTYLSLPGRCVVLMPGSDSSGISRKISGEEKRSQLREAMNSIDVPEGIGWIVRTASVDITEEILARDVAYLLRLWDEIKRKGQELEGVGLVYEEQHSILRFLREHFDPSIEEILVDDRAALEQVKEFVEMLPAEQRKVRVRLHKGARPIFNQYSVEDQIESIYQSQGQSALRRIDRDRSHRGPGGDRRQFRVDLQGQEFRGLDLPGQHGGGVGTGAPAAAARPRRPDRGRLHRTCAARKISVTSNGRSSCR